MTFRLPFWFLVSVVLLLALFAMSAAFGQNPQSAPGTTDYSTTLGTTATQCIPANSARRTLSIENPNGGANNVCYSTGTPSCGAAGTSVIVPGGLDFWAYGSAPRDAINCIGSGASTPVTIRSGQ